MPGGTRPGPVPLTAAAVAAVLLAAIGLVGGPAVRGAIGAGTSSVTLPGTGVVVVRSGDAGTLDAAGSQDGAVVAVVNGVPTLVAAAAGGPTISSGTYAARPASPAAGDIYTVTSGARRGSVYRAPATGVWELWRVLPPVSATVMLDGERFDGSASGAWVLTWPGELGASAVAISQSSTMTVLSSAAGGLPGVTFTSPVGMRVPWMGPSGADPRWLAVVMSRAAVGSGTYTHVAGWGAGAGGGQLFALTSRTGGSAVVGAHWWFSGLASAVAPAGGTTPSLYILQYDGTTATIYADGTSIASGAVALSTGTSSVLTLGLNPVSLAEPANCTLHAVLAGSGTLDSTARSALRTWSQDRFGSP